MCPYINKEAKVDYGQILLMLIKCSVFRLSLVLYVPVIIYGHVGTVSSPNHIFFLGKPDKAVNQYIVHILLLVTDNNPS